MRIEIDKDQLAEVKAATRHIKNGFRTAVGRSIKKTLSTMKTNASQEIRKDLAVKASIVAKELKVYTAAYRYMQGKFVDVSYPLGLIHFGAKQNKTGVSVKVKKAVRRTTVKHAFIARGRNDNRQVFWRERQGGKMVPRLPIEKLTGPRIADILANPKVFDVVMKNADAALAANLDHETEYLISRAG